METDQTFKDENKATEHFAFCLICLETHFDGVYSKKSEISVIVIEIKNTHQIPRQMLSNSDLWCAFFLGSSLQKPSQLS